MKKGGWIDEGGSLEEFYPGRCGRALGSVSLVRIQSPEIPLDFAEPESMLDTLQGALGASRNHHRTSVSKPDRPQGETLYPNSCPRYTLTITISAVFYVRYDLLVPLNYPRRMRNSFGTIRREKYNTRLCLKRIIFRRDDCYYL